MQFYSTTLFLIRSYRVILFLLYVYTISTRDIYNRLSHSFNTLLRMPRANYTDEGLEPISVSPTFPGNKLRS